jgi:ATP-citrate lyase beta-subunit
MAQVAIREFDAKSMFYSFLGVPYQGYLIQSQEDIGIFSGSTQLLDQSWVIKPDQLFGKRGKYGLVGVNLDITSIRDWYTERANREVEIKSQRGVLHTFLIEPFVPHDDEYYVAIRTERDGDVMYFSRAGGVDVEENWESVQEVSIPLGKTYDITLERPFWVIDDGDRVYGFLAKLYQFFCEYGFTYLEINPFTFAKSGEIVCLDMVARVDDCEAFKQKKHWEHLEFVHPFGSEKTQREEYIAKLDAATGASLKFRLLNPHGKIWLLTSGGGASVILADTLANMGYADMVANYGECSGNPDRENTKAYTLTLLDSLIENGQKGQYLLIAGAIANFTHIDKTFAGIIDALTERADILRDLDLQILVRRGGINDEKWLAMMKASTEKLGLKCEIASGAVYMTDILWYISLPWSQK